MKRYRHWLNPLLAAIALMFTVVAWLLFAPLQFGGQAAYVIVAGNSMEPLFHRGDLVIVRQASVYQVGDIVTYRHPEIGPVIHRIVAQEENRFVLKGDHNTWFDSYLPTPAEFIGKFWLHVPSAGKIIEQLRKPWPLAILAIGVGGIVVKSVAGSQAQAAARQQGRKRQVGGQRRSMSQLSRSKADWVAVLVTLALASGLLAFFAFTRPLSYTIYEDINYQHKGEFSYSAAAPPGIYDTDTVQTGDPIFRRLITLVTVNFNYQFVADQPADLSGSHRLLAEIANSNGWVWTVELQPETPFSGPTFTTSGVIDLARLQALIDNLHLQTGLTTSQYTLTVIPTVVVSGSLAGQQLQDQFAPRLVFQLDELQMQLAPAGGLASEAADPLKPSQARLLKRPREAPATLSLLGLTLPVSTARQLAITGLALAMAGLLGLGWFILRAFQGGEVAHIELKYGSLLVAVRGSDLTTGERVIEVASIDDLAKIAERDGRMILHQARGSTHDYFVQDNGLTYHYRVDAPAQEEG